MGNAGRWAAVALMLALMGSPIARASAAGAATTLRGRVLAADGTPAAGAGVRLIRLNVPALSGRATTADPDGRFVAEVEPGAWLLDATLGEQGAGEGITVHVIGGERDHEPVAIRLRPGGRLRGRLVELETGRAIAGARFVLDNGEAPVTDLDGRFEAGGLSRTGDHEAVTVAPGRERLRVRFAMADGPLTELEVAVPRGAKAVGLVVAPDGRPIPRATVARGFGGNSFAETGLCVGADEQGRFVYDGLRPGQAARFEVRAAGFRMAERADVRPGPLGEPVAFLVRLDPYPPAAPGLPIGPAVATERIVAGVVLGPAGQPVADALIRWGFGPAPEATATRTDAAGRFRFAVPDGAEQLCVFPRGLDLAPAVVPVGPHGDRELRVNLERARTAAGVVRDDRGTALGHVAVTPMFSRQGEWTLALPDLAATTDARGRFVLPGLPGSDVTAQFVGDGVIGPGNPPLVFDRENLVTMQPTGAIRGRVVDEVGRPVRNFRVLVHPSREIGPGDRPGSYAGGFGGFGLSVTADDGSFLLRHLVAGAVQRVTIVAPGRGSESIDRVVAEPNNRLDPDRIATFRLGPPHRLVIRVRDGVSGAPLPWARVAVIADEMVALRNRRQQEYARERNDSAHADSDEAGVAGFERLAIADATVVVERPGYLKEEARWHAGVLNLAVGLAPEAVLAGELRDRATNRPVEEGFVRLASLTTGQQVTQVLPPGGGGRFRFDGLPGGACTLSIWSAGSQIHRETIIVKAGTVTRWTTPLDFRPAGDDPIEAPALD